MSSVHEELLNLVVEARSKCVTTHTPRYQLLRDLDEDGEREFIVGSCVQNAEILAKHINNHSEFTASVVRGGLDIEGEPTPSSYSEAKKIGTLHHWVKVDTPEGLYYADVSQENRATANGGPLVTRTVPSNYKFL